MKTKLLILLLLSVGMFGSSLQAYDDTGVAGAKILQFIVIGDWGLPGSKGQKLVAAQMDRLAASTPIDFIASTGDNFYGRGVKSVDDPLWHRVFESVYSLPALKDVPWYLALGNHDYMGDTKAQIEYSENHSNWNLPDTYHSQVFNGGRTALYGRLNGAGIGSGPRPV